MKKVYKFGLIFLLSVFVFTNKVNASTNKIYVNIETNEMSSDGKKYSSIVEYDTLEEFLTDYESGSLPDIYLTSFLFDGVSTVKSYDLDDFIEDGNDVKVKELSIDVLNINTKGNIELTGERTGLMFAVNTNSVKGDINLILNNVNIDTDTKKSPVIYVYNKDINYSDAKVTIKTTKGSVNTLEGGKFKKVSLVGSDELDNYSNYYSGEVLDNYKAYTNYYGVYTKEEIENILFAKVSTDSEGLMEGDSYYFYKGSGAISSDIDLYFEGEGYLKVISKNKEGIETKGNLTFSGSTGDYEIIAMDDCLNTTTSNRVGDNVRNSLTIDVNSLLAIVSDDADEGDAIDSNGTLTINGGNIFAFAHSSSQDSGLDSEDGIFINGGTVISTGNMADMVDTSSKQDYIYISFNEKISKDTLIVIKDESDNIITAFQTSKDISTLLYSTDELDYESLKIYTGGTIDGESENGLYTKINNYTNGEEVSFSLVKSMNMKSDNFILKLLCIEVVLLVITLLFVVIDKVIIKKRTNN